MISVLCVCNHLHVENCSQMLRLVVKKNVHHLSADHTIKHKLSSLIASPKAFGLQRVEHYKLCFLYTMENLFAVLVAPNARRKILSDILYYSLDTIRDLQMIYSVRVNSKHVFVFFCHLD